MVENEKQNVSAKSKKEKWMKQSRKNNNSGTKEPRGEKNGKHYISKETISSFFPFSHIKTKHILVFNFE